jgi:hypothetical protein
MQNISVQTRNESKWLAMTKPGYWFPRQFNKEIKDGFSLSFDVEWPQEIPYYSGYFNLTISEMKYDNAQEKYISESEYQSQYWSLYSGYAGNFNRIILSFDPYWNNTGTLEIYTYDVFEKLRFSKTIKLPDFYKEKNKHRLTIQRNGDGLVVSDNGKEIADLSGVFLNNVRYNLYTFSKYKENQQGESGDMFYLKNIRTVY